MKVWIMRDWDDGDDDSCVVIKEQEPKLNTKTNRWDTTYGEDDDFDMYISVPHFKKKFGFTPRKGYSCQHELTLRRL